MDFVHDQLGDGRRFRVFTVVDDFTRKSIVLHVGTSLPSSCVAEVLQQAMQAHGAPEVLICDNGPEFTSLDLMKWAACPKLLRSAIVGAPWSQIPGAMDQILLARNGS